MCITHPNACADCGSIHTVPIEGRQAAYIWCIGCGKESPPYPNLQEAVTAWNAENPCEVCTTWFYEPIHPGGPPHLISRSFLADSMDLSQYEQRIIQPPGKSYSILAYVPKQDKPHA